MVDGDNTTSIFHAKDTMIKDPPGNRRNIFWLAEVEVAMAYTNGIKVDTTPTFATVKMKRDRQDGEEVEEEVGEVGEEAVGDVAEGDGGVVFFCNASATVIDATQNNDKATVIAIIKELSKGLTGPGWNV